MKKQYIFFCFWLLLIGFAKAQNLVPNPSFETYTTCPTSFTSPGQDYIKYAPPWQMATGGTADYYNICNTQWESAGVPNNFSGFQYAKTGNSYVGICTKDDYTNNYREYICAPLLSSLVNGAKYCVSMYVNLADTNYINGSHIFSTDAIGIYLSNGYPDTTGVYGGGHEYGFIGGFGHIYKIPQIESISGSLISDTMNWTKISGFFTASGGENYITIGNFKSDSSTMGNGQYSFDNSYYYIDEINISLDSTRCLEQGETSIKQNSSPTNSSVYPNPVKQEATLTFSNPKNQNCTLMLYDTQGIAVTTINNITSNKVKISAANLHSGLYYYVINSKDDVLATGKLVVE